MFRYTTPLNRAVDNGHLDAVILLIEHGAVVDDILDCYMEHHPLIRAIENNNYDISKLLLGMIWVDIDMLFRVAVECGSNDVFQLLIDHGADINGEAEFSTDTCDEMKSTPLTLAACYDNVDSYKLLVDMGANEDPFPGTDLTPLMFAIHSEAHDMLAYLISIGKDINTKSNSFHHAPYGIMRSVELDDIRSVRMLLDAGVDIDAMYYFESEWHTILSFAVSEQDIGIARMLIDRGADVNKPECDEHSRCPLLIAAMDDDMAMSKLLIDAGATTVMYHDGHKKSIHISEGEVITLIHKTRCNAICN